MSSADIPLVTIGVPVYNEAAFLEPALESLLDQDYGKFEIVISDNGSEDETQKICEEFARKDERIRYHRMPANRGAAVNSNRVIELASGSLFLRAAGHDLWSPNYVSSCVRELEAQPNAVIAFGSTQWIDNTNRAYPKETGWTDTRGMSAMERFFTQLWGNMHPIMGVARTNAVRSVLPFTDMAAADLAFLLEMSLIGDFLHAGDATWYRRELRGPQTYRDRMRRYRSSEFGLINSRLSSMAPYGKLLLRMPRSIWRAPVSLPEKLTILALLYPTAVGRYLGARRRHDEAYALETEPPT